jgi:hypothetical protein
MIKWFAYIVLLLIMTPALLSAKDKGNQYVFNNSSVNKPVYTVAIDTTSTTNKNTKKQSDQDNKKVKEIGKAKRQPKPEKIAPADASATTKPKPKRQRRPEGLERPPEIPRRNGGG